MPTQQPADIILLHGQVLCMDQRLSVQQAVAIRNGRIQATGRDEDIQNLRGHSTTVIDLQDRTVIPGIIDTHAHMDREGLKNIQPGLEGITCIADILQIVKRQVARTPPGEWVVTMPIGNRPNYADVTEQIAEGRYPTRWELDSVSPDHPVYIRGIWTPWNVPPGVSVGNSRALQLAGIDRHTQAPHSSVVIERDDYGEPTGVIVDYNMYPVVEFSLMRVVPRFTHDDRTRALRESMQLYNSVGTTSIYEGHGVAPELLQVYKSVWDAGEMTVRNHLVLSPTWTSLSEAGSDMARWSHSASGFGFGDDMLRICGYFIQLRGQPHVARLRSAELPFTGWAGFAESYNSPANFRSLLRLAAQHNLRVHTLAATEDNLEDVLQAFESIAAEFPIAGQRWILEHVLDVNPSQLPRIRRLGVVCETIPLTHIWLRGGAYLDNPERAAHMVPHQDFLQHGIPFGMGTDNKPYNPFDTLWAAVVRRERRTGAVIAPQQCLTRVQALHAFTMGGAYFCGVENQRGSLEAGKLADLAVLSNDPLQVPDDQIPDLHAVLTIVGGQVVHDRAGLAAGGQ